MNYYIDFENVKSGGMCGVDRLSENDKVIVFYTDETCRVTFDLMQKLMDTKAQKEFVEVKIVAQNSLDFQLVTRLGYDVAGHEDEEFIIISGDKGFRTVVAYWGTRNVKIAEYPSIEKSRENTELTVNDVLKLIPDAPEAAEYVTKILADCTNRNDLYQLLLKAYGNAKTYYIYNAVKQYVAANIARKAAERAAKAAERKAKIAAEKTAAAKSETVSVQLSDENVVTESAEVTSQTTENTAAEAAVTAQVIENTAAEVTESAAETAVEEAAEVSEATETSEVSKVPETIADEPSSESETAQSTDEVVTEKVKKAPAKRGRPKKKASSEPVLSDLIPQYADDIDKIGKIIGKYKTKLGISKALVREYEDDKAGAIYSLITPLLKDKKGKGYSEA